MNEDVCDYIAMVLVSTFISVFVSVCVSTIVANFYAWRLKRRFYGSAKRVERVSDTYPPKC